MTTTVTLVTGGARSGKSAFAEALARGAGDRTLYVATAEALDDEMAARIAHHRARRPASWRTEEAPLDLGAAMRRAGADVDVALVDCLSVWAANRLLALGDEAQPGWWERVRRLEVALAGELEQLVATTREIDVRLILVTNEVGAGVVPPTPLGRAYRDLLGRLNQVAARRVDEVYLVVAGLGVDLKRLAIATPVAP